MVIGVSKPPRIDQTFIGQKKWWGATDGLTYSNVHHIWGNSGAAILDLAHVDHLDMLITECVFEGLLVNEDWFMRLRDLVGTFEISEVVFKHLQHEHCFYGQANACDLYFGNITAFDIGSQLFQLRRAYGPKQGKGHTMQFENIDAEDCGMKHGRRPGFSAITSSGHLHHAVVNNLRSINKNEVKPWLPKSKDPSKAKYHSPHAILFKDNESVDINNVLIDHKNPERPVVKCDTNDSVVGGKRIILADDDWELTNVQNVSIPKLRRSNGNFLVKYRKPGAMKAKLLKRIPLKDGIDWSGGMPKSASGL